MQKISNRNKTRHRTKKKSNAISKTHVMKLLDTTKTSLESDKAEDVAVIDLTGKTSFADYMVIATGSSERHVASMAVHLKEKLKSIGRKQISLEGTKKNDWVLIDSGDLVVHLFRSEIREFYALEKIWSSEISESDEVA